MASGVCDGARPRSARQRSLGDRLPTAVLAPRPCSKSPTDRSRQPEAAPRLAEACGAVCWRPSAGRRSAIIDDRRGRSGSSGGTCVGRGRRGCRSLDVHAAPRDPAQLHAPRGEPRGNPAAARRSFTSSRSGTARSLRRTSSRIWIPATPGLRQDGFQGVAAVGAADCGERPRRPRPATAPRSRRCPRRRKSSIVDADFRTRPFRARCSRSFGFPAHELELIRGSAFSRAPIRQPATMACLSRPDLDQFLLGSIVQPLGKFAGGSYGFFLARGVRRRCGK